MRSADVALLAALRRELHELGCVAPDTYDVSDFIVPDEVVDRTMARLRERIARLECSKEAA